MAVETKEWIDEKGRKKQRAGFAKTAVVNSENKVDAQAFANRYIAKGSELNTDGSTSLSYLKDLPVRHKGQALGIKIGCMTIDIDRLREAVAAGVVKEALHGWKGPLVVIRNGRRPDQWHRQCNPSKQAKAPFLRASRGGSPVSARFLAGLPEFFLKEPSPQRFSSNPDLFPLEEFLLGKRGAKAPVAGLVKPEDSGTEGIGMAAVGNPSFELVKDSLFSLDSHPSYDSLDLAEGKVQEAGDGPPPFV